MNANGSSILARALRGFLTDYLPTQRAISPHTVHSYRDSLKLLLQFAAGRTADPSTLTLDDFSVERITAFLSHLEKDRRNAASTRNVRLSALHSFFRYVGAHHPEYLEHTQRLLAIPFKRTQTRTIQYLEFAEIQSILSSMDRSRPRGRRDFVLLTLLFNTGARVSEVVGLVASDFRLQAPASVHLRGKGRKERICPLWPATARLLRAFLEEQHIAPDQLHAVFHNLRGTPLTRFGVRFILKKHVQRTMRLVPSLARKRLHPHSIRHSTAVHLLRAGVDLITIANWFGHSSLNTTNKYIAIDMEAKRRALAQAKPLLDRRCDRQTWRRDPGLIAWLESL